MLNGRNILIMEDESLLRKSLCHYLDSLGAMTFPASSLAEAREIRDTTELDFALLDINLPDGNGLDLLGEQKFSSNTRIVMMTADGGIRTAIDAIKHGASDYLSKPFDPEELPMVFSRISRETAQSRIKEFEKQSRTDSSGTLFFGKRMEQLKEQVSKILTTDQRLGVGLPPVLIEGETGTGKSTLARWLHENGPRNTAPLIEINCSTLPESLAESELFGHEKGAFTDARKQRIGLFEAADGGSLFLDEIGSLSSTIQAKVLTAVEDGLIRRVGSNTPRKVDVRLIAASLHPLQELVQQKSFREDLYHRLNLLHIRIPALRDYPEDLPMLASSVLSGLKKRYRQPDATLTNAGKQRILSYDWPGNIRELIHEIERNLIFSDSGQLDFLSLEQPGAGQPAANTAASLLNPAWTIPEEGFQFEEELGMLTRQVIEEALEQEKGNVSAVARRLGVARDFVRYRLNS